MVWVRRGGGVVLCLCVEFENVVYIVHVKMCSGWVFFKILGGGEGGRGRSVPCLEGRGEFNRGSS